MSAPSVLFVHGSFFSGWCWLPVIERLAPAGVRCTAVELPFTSLDDDVRHLRHAIDSARREGPVAVVCHSYTGITTALAGHDADHLVFIAARLPAVDEAPAAISAQWNAPGFRECMQPHGRGLWLSDEAEPLLFHRTPPDIARLAMERRRPLFSTIPAEPITDPAWRSVETTYVVCTDDRAVSVEQQRVRATWVQHSVELDCDHSPFFSAPDRLAEVLIGVTDTLSHEDWR